MLWSEWPSLKKKNGPEWPYELLCEVANLKWEGPVDLHHFKEKQKKVKETFSIFCIGEFAYITISFGD